jgi:hypothetical protein
MHHQQHLLLLEDQQQQLAQVAGLDLLLARCRLASDPMVGP